jgi:hypothetical protein
LAPDDAGVFFPDPDPDPLLLPAPALTGVLGVAAGVVFAASPDPLESLELDELVDPESLLEDVEPALILPCWELRESFR